jgi:hypothetical protein
MLDEWSDDGGGASGDFGMLVAGAAVFSVIADQLESGGSIPSGLVVLALEFSNTTSRLDSASRRVYSAASSALQDLLEGPAGRILV